MRALAGAVLIGAAVVLAACAGEPPVVEPPNNAPQVDGLFVSPEQPLAGETALLSALVRDADGDPLAVLWEVEDGAIEVDGFGAVWRTPATAGAYRATLSAEDPAGARVRVVLFVPVSAPPKELEPGNRLPVITSLTATPDMVVAGDIVTLAAEGYDPDGDALVFEFRAPPGELTQLGLTAEYVAFYGVCEAGDYAFSVRIDDGRGGVAEQAVSVFIDPSP